jgi:hypothetical protein
MGGWRIGVAVAVAVLLRAPLAVAGTVVEPIARLSLEGGYDTNALYDGRSADKVGRIAPDVGLHLHDPLWDLKATYGGELIYYQRLAPTGTWNHRGAFTLDARPTYRTTLFADARTSQAFDPGTLAQAGLFRIGAVRALIVTARARAEWRVEETRTLAGTFNERTVIFQDGTGGAMHAPGVEALQRLDRRLSMGVGYGFGMFQSFLRNVPDQVSYSNAARVVARWRAERHLGIYAWAGPALWSPKGGSSSVVPEAFVELLVATRGLDLRLNGGHALGIGATAEPGLVDSLEFGGERRFGRDWFIRGIGGLWRSGTVPSQKFAATGYATEGDVGVILAGGLRLSVTGAHFARVDISAAQYRRTTVGLKLEWELKQR